MEIFDCLKCGTSFEADLRNDIVCCPNCGNMDFPETKLRAGFHINGFELKKKIGSGAMGQVWLAVQISMQRYVAIKILSPSVCSRLGFIERFQGEIKNSAKLEHPNIITAFDAGCKSGFYYLASSYVDGENLEQILVRKKRIEEKVALKIALGIAEALSYAWSEFNLLHRDIKPSNIIIDKNDISKLMDMGLSKCVNEDPSLTYDGEIVGTPYYMSPEQAKGKTDLDLRSDIYSLGATLYHLVTGQLPFDGSNSVGILTKHITEPLVPPIERNNLITLEVNSLIIKMMEKTLASRIQTWYEVIGEIKNILESRARDEAAQKIKPEIVEGFKDLTEEFAGEEYENLDNNKKNKPVKPKKRQNIFIRIIFSLIFLGIIGAVFYYTYFYFLKEIVQDNSSSTSLLASVNIEVNKHLSSLITDVQTSIFKNKDYFPGTATLDFKIIVFELVIILLVLFSGFWASAKAQKNSKNCFIHFLGGILIPYIYPLFIYNIKGKSIKNGDEDEIPEKKIVKYFERLAKKGKAKESCFEFELLDDSKIYAEHIIEVKSNMLVLQVYSETGDSKSLRIPYTRIKNFVKL
jgi:eukaryotic-like serine/threonine-protein kinase